MEEKSTKKSYYLPDELTEVFAEWCKPGRDYSPRMAAFILAGLVMNDHHLIKKLSELAHSGDLKYDKKSRKVIGKSYNEAKRLIVDYFLKAELNQLLDNLSPQEQSQIIAGVKKAIK